MPVSFPRHSHGCVGSHGGCVGRRGNCVGGGGHSGCPLPIGSPVEKMCFFFTKLTITYPLGTSNIELFLTNKMPHFTCNFSHFAYARAHTFGAL